MGDRTHQGVCTTLHSVFSHRFLQIPSCSSYCQPDPPRFFLVGRNPDRSARITKQKQCLESKFQGTNTALTRGKWIGDRFVVGLEAIGDKVDLASGPPRPPTIPSVIDPWPRFVEAQCVDEKGVMVRAPPPVDRAFPVPLFNRPFPPTVPLSHSDEERGGRPPAMVHPKTQRPAKGSPVF